jgi:hypothetical protein
MRSDSIDTQIYLVIIYGRRYNIEIVENRDK